MTAQHLYFRSPAHQQRFVATIQQIGKVYDGTLDQEYAAALYILTSSLATWHKAEAYVDHHGIDIAAMIEGEDLSGGASVLIALAGNLFNGQIHLDPVEFVRLDATNYLIALTALHVRRAPLHLTDL